MPQAPTPTASRMMQGILVPASSVNDDEFHARTRRRIYAESKAGWAGLGATDRIELKKTGIIAKMDVRLSGSITVTPGTGTVATTGSWPYDLYKQIRFTANGQSNLVRAAGSFCKVREIVCNEQFNDAGVPNIFAGATVNRGSLALSNESWGVGSNTTAIANGTYDIDLIVPVPVAEDMQDLHGAIFAQTSSTELSLEIDWANLADIFVTTGDATVVFDAFTLEVQTERYSIPLDPNGQIIVPDLSVFHSFIETQASGLSTGPNEVKLAGQGAGKTLLRTFNRLKNGAPSAPVPVTDANFGNIAWIFGGNESPDGWSAGQIAYWNELLYNSPIGKYAGMFCLDFATVNAFRDSVDLGTTSEWRHLVNIQSTLALNNAILETVSESVFAAGAGS